MQLQVATKIQTNHTKLEMYISRRSQPVPSINLWLKVSIERRTTTHGPLSIIYNIYCIVCVVHILIHTIHTMSSPRFTLYNAREALYAIWAQCMIYSLCTVHSQGIRMYAWHSYTLAACVLYTSWMYALDSMSYRRCLWLPLPLPPHEERTVKFCAPRRLCACICVQLNGV